jgi:hypothetical protein
MYLFRTLFFLLLPSLISAQQTLLLSAPNDTIDLSCAACSTWVTDLALVRGHQSIPINLDKPVKENLLHWTYYDGVSEEWVTTELEPVWTQGVQLWEKLADTVVISLHVNLSVSDSTGEVTRIFLVLGGMVKSDLKKMPITGVYDVHTYEPLRFSAIVQPPIFDRKKQALECIDGTLVLQELHLKKRKVLGDFEFIANKIGIKQLVLFQNGHF